MLTVVADEAGREDLAASLDEIVREGARRMLAAALEEEVPPTSPRTPVSRPGAPRYQPGPAVHNF